MSALFYLYRKRLKNRIKSIFKSPGQLVLIVVFAGLIALNLFAAGKSEPTGSYRDISELYAALLAVLAVIFILVSYSGISRGGSLFSMPDVNFIFVSPIKPVRTLFYGLVQQLGTAFLMGYFIIMQYAWMNSTYGIEFSALLLILAGYAVAIVCGQMTSMLIYSLTSSRTRNRQIARYTILTLCVLPIAYILIRAVTSGTDLIAGAVSAANNPIISLFPVAGWLRAAIVGLWTGEMLPVAAGVGASLLYIGLLFFLLSKSGDNYYEDVLRTTETKFKTVMASKSGEIAEAVPENVKLGKIGLSRGFGADALYFKHKLENRRARVFLFDLSSVIFLGMSIMFGVFMRGEGISMVFSMTTYLMIFTVALGRWMKELVKPYIYMIPEPPFKKLLHCLRESLIKLAAEAVILYAVLAWILQLSIPEFIMAVVARMSFGILFVSANIFIERFFGFVTVKLIAVMLFFVSMIVFAVPGIAVTAIIATMQLVPLPENLLIFTSLSVVNTLIALLVTYLSRNMLEYAELNTR